MKVYIDNSWYDEQDAKISVFDHGLLYGDGVFEGIRAYNGRVFKLKEHIERLYDSARAICLDIPMSQEEMCDVVVQSCVVNKISDGYIRLVITRGVGTLGLNPYLCKKASVICIAANIQLYPVELYESGLRVITAGTTRNIPEAVNPRIKSLNYLNNVMAKIEAINAGTMECIMLNAMGYVAEASGDNIFAVRGKTIKTPPVWCGALEGITRNTVMELAEKAGYTVVEEVLSRYDLYIADEVFLSGTAAEIIGVVDIDRRVISGGTPGPITRELEANYREHANSSGADISL